MTLSTSKLIRILKLRKCLVLRAAGFKLRAPLMLSYQSRSRNKVLKTTKMPMKTVVDYLKIIMKLYRWLIDSSHKTASLPIITLYSKQIVACNRPSNRWNLALSRLTDRIRDTMQLSLWDSMRRLCKPSASVKCNKRGPLSKHVSRCWSTKKKWMVWRRLTRQK